jgi:hypothetical protein
MTSENIKNFLRLKHPANQGWLIIPELRDGTGFDKRAIDIFAINLWPSKKMTRIAYEIKISVSDFKRELSNPDKRNPFVRFANEFYFITPVGLLDRYRDAIPPECGLMECDDQGKIKKILDSDYFEHPPTWGIIASIANRMMMVNGEEPSKYL